MRCFTIYASYTNDKLFLDNIKVHVSLSLLLRIFSHANLVFVQFMSTQAARTYFRQIVRAIAYCHRLHVVHRDLKPENVVFFEKLGTVKLTDFGFSNRFCPGQKLETSCGSLAYSAPEILLGESYDAPAVGNTTFSFIITP